MAATPRQEFGEFYQAVFGRLVGQLVLVIGDLHEAEDIAQEALARAAARWSRLRDYDVPEAWVRRWRRPRVDAARRSGSMLTKPPMDVPATSRSGAANRYGRR